MNSNDFNVGVGLNIPGLSMNFPVPNRALTAVERMGIAPVLQAPVVFDQPAPPPPQPVAPQVTEPVVVTPPAQTSTLAIVGVVAAVAALSYGAYWYINQG
jgi:hypothetical protein